MKQRSIEFSRITSVVKSRVAREIVIGMLYKFLLDSNAWSAGKSSEPVSRLPVDGDISERAGWIIIALTGTGVGFEGVTMERMRMERRMDTRRERRESISKC